MERVLPEGFGSDLVEGLHVDEALDEAFLVHLHHMRGDAAEGVACVYALQLAEKQKVKFVYGVMERQFRSYYEKASRMPGKTGENLLILVERRLDNVVYRLGFAMTRREARQLVSHAHFTVNGQKVNIPSYLVRVGDVIEVKEGSRSAACFKRLTAEDAPMVNVPQWLQRDKNALKGTVVQMPAREDIDMPIEEHLIVELYSK